MRSRAARLLGALAAAALLFAPLRAPAAAAGSGADRIRREKARLEETRRKAEKTAAELSETIGREKNTRERMAELRERLARQKRIVSRIDRKLGLLGEEQDRMEAEARGLADRKAHAGRAVSSMTVNLFLMARDRPGLLFRTGRDERLRHFAGKILAGRVAEYGRLATDTEEVEEKLDGIERQLRVSAKRKRAEQGVGAALASRTEAEGRKLEEIARQKKRKEKELRALRARVASMEALVRKIERRIREREQKAGVRPPRGEAPRFAGVPGGLVAPVSGRVVSRFGSQRDPVFDVVLENRGIEIEGPSGAPVRAVARGEVVFNGDVDGFGNVLILQHGSGLFSVYGKAGSLSVRRGQKVAAGQGIGRLPESPDGKSVLYLELRAAGSAVDPLSAIPSLR